jgi:hypothetical protein
VEENRGPGYKSTVMPNSFLTKVLKTYDREKKASSTILAGKSYYLPAETETRSMFMTLC